MSEIELSEGYTPSIVGKPSRIIPTDVLEAYKQQAATRVLKKRIWSRNTRTLSPEDLNIGDDVAYYYNTSKAN